MARPKRISPPPGRGAQQGQSKTESELELLVVNGHKYPFTEEQLLEMGRMELAENFPTKAAAIRALHDAGLSTKEIAQRMGVIYQQVRNTLNRGLKKSAWQRNMATGANK